MNLTQFRLETDSDGIALVTWDVPGKNMNLINAAMMSELEQIVDATTADANVKGVVVASGKDHFSGGADLTMLEASGRALHEATKREGADKAMQAFFDATSKLSLIYRKIETCGNPWAVAINGTCVGGGFELALACHHRVMADDDKTRVGLPEIKIGLFPGGGGTTRVARLMPTPDALQMLLKGDQIKPAAAKAKNLVHALAPRAEIVQKAKDWIKTGGKAGAPWDVKEFRAPSGKVFSPGGMMIWPPANAIYRRETYDNYPAARAILASVFEGLQLPMDLALAVESKHFANILLSKEAAAMIRSLFLSMGELNKGARRPANFPPTNLRKIGVLGAGLMGAGVAYVSASAGLEVVLIDRDQESADKGKAYSDKIVSSQIAKGRAKTADKEALLARIRATADYSELKGCDLIIEAVFEDRAVKAEATRKAQAVVGPDIVFASNTSTLP
uniref:3-hydroxyacyl-CoA dehydrogenase NAD-binding domain-containing protein n=1 Tax=Rhodoblastus sp. TaxID=1962975 RepID=UPI003F9B39D2